MENSNLSSILHPQSSLPPPPRMSDEYPVNRAEQIPERAGRIRHLEQPAAQGGNNALHGQFRRPRDAGVIGPESVKAMSIGSRDQRLLETFRDFDRAPVRIE